MSTAAIRAMGLLLLATGCEGKGASPDCGPWETYSVSLSRAPSDAAPWTEEGVLRTNRDDIDLELMRLHAHAELELYFAISEWVGEGRRRRGSTDTDACQPPGGRSLPNPGVCVFWEADALDEAGEPGDVVNVEDYGLFDLLAAVEGDTLTVGYTDAADQHQLVSWTITGMLTE